jgi:hypothetical protein
LLRISFKLSADDDAGREGVLDNVGNVDEDGEGCIGDGFD